MIGGGKGESSGVQSFPIITNLVVAFCTRAVPLKEETFIFSAILT